MSDKNEIVIKENQHIKYIDENLSLIQNQNQLSDVDLKNFAIQCKRTGLDPITRQIYAIPNNGKMTIMASIDGLRLIADRSGLYEGQAQPQWCGQDGVWVDVWLKKEAPAACKIGVHKKNFKEALFGIAIFDEYAGKHQWDDNRNTPPKHKKGDLTFMWAKMPALMIAKVAEALALRKAFPNEMSGIYSTEEMDQTIAPREVNIVAAIDGHKSEKKHITEKVVDIQNANHKIDNSDLGSYVVKCGKKYAGMKLSDMKDFEIVGYLKYLDEGAAKNQKDLTGDFLEFYQKATAYVNQKNDVGF
jgi:phage recombination protein Bet